MIATILLLLVVLIVIVGAVGWFWRREFIPPRERPLDDPERACAENDRPLTHSILGYSDGRERLP